MALHHASSGELIDIRPVSGPITSSLSKALYVSKQLEVFRMFLEVGKRIPIHKVMGDVTVQCIEGAIELEVRGHKQLMRPGDLICVAGGDEHALFGVEAGSVLVSLVLNKA